MISLAGLLIVSFQITHMVDTMISIASDYPEDSAQSSFSSYYSKNINIKIIYSWVDEYG
jgi:hypothetical protein